MWAGKTVRTGKNGEGIAFAAGETGLASATLGAAALAAGKIGGAAATGRWAMEGFPAAVCAARAVRRVSQRVRGAKGRETRGRRARATGAGSAETAALSARLVQDWT